MFGSIVHGGKKGGLFCRELAVEKRRRKKTYDLSRPSFSTSAPQPYTPEALVY
jgi:hypothetical protein